MRAINLIPKDTRRGAGGVAAFRLSPSYAILAVLVIALALVTVVVLTDNTISDRQAKLASLHSQLAAEQARVGELAPYQRFAQLAQARISTVRQIVGTRFDWHGALADLSKVVPANTSLQTLNASVSPSSGSGGSTVRGDISAPAFSITGCTRSQDDVARLMSRLRIMDGVTRVTLQSSTSASGSGTTAPATTSGSGSACASGPSFDLVVFFSAPPALGPATTTTTGVTK